MKKKATLVESICIIYLAVTLFINCSCMQKKDVNTGEFVVIENFEKYDNGDPQALSSSWTDGFESNKNGGLIGHLSNPFLELNTVHSGGQSAPVYYDLKNENYAEVTIDTNKLPIDKDWTKYSSNLLSLWFYGHKENIYARMYVKLNDSKVYYEGNSDDMTKAKWTRWDIELSKFKTDLKNISTLSIGFDKSEEHPDGMGIIFFDDIRLYKKIQ